MGAGQRKRHFSRIDEVEKLLKEYDIKATIISAQSQIAISAADLVLSKSGTVNLETALLNVPQVILYRVSAITAWIARNIIKLKLPFISPVNLVNMESVVPEFVQNDAIPEAIAASALELLTNQEARQTMLNGYIRVRESLGEKGIFGHGEEAEALHYPGCWIWMSNKYKANLAMHSVSVWDSNI